MSGPTGPAHSPADALGIASGVPDPELPMVTVADLGILREVRQSGAAVEVTITPTYSGCPAMREISQDLSRRLLDAGFFPVAVRSRLAPPWTSDWITEAGRDKLAAAGIALPGRRLASRPRTPVPLTLTDRPAVTRCPRCRSGNVEVSAEFGATACRSLYRCLDCREPFEYFKEI